VSVAASSTTWLAVIPFVERGRLVLTLVALQAQQVASGDLRQRLGEFGLANSRRPLEQDRLVQPALQEDRRRESLIGEIAC
jgi:hypothetical protein